MDTDNNKMGIGCGWGEREAGEKWREGEKVGTVTG